MPRKPRRNLPVKLDSIPAGIPDAVGDDGLTPAQVMLNAGISRDEMSERVKQAWNTLVELLQAEKTEFFSHQGLVTDSRQVADLSLQRQAALDLIRLSGAEPSKTRTNVLVKHTLLVDNLGRQPERVQVIDVPSSSPNTD